MGQGDVFHQEIERDAAEAGSGIVQFVPEIPERQEFREKSQQRQIADGEPDEQDFDRREAAQQHLGRNEGGTPDQDGQQRGEVSGGVPAERHGLASGVKIWRYWPGVTPIVRLKTRVKWL